MLPDRARVGKAPTGAPRIAALVAHHSEGRFTAAARGLLAELERFPREEGAVADGLVHADMSAAPHGGRVTVHDRLADVWHRHAMDPPELQWARTRCASPSW